MDYRPETQQMEMFERVATSLELLEHYAGITYDGYTLKDVVKALNRIAEALENNND